MFNTLDNGALLALLKDQLDTVQSCMLTATEIAQVLEARKSIVEVQDRRE